MAVTLTSILVWLDSLPPDGEIMNPYQNLKTFSLKNFPEFLLNSQTYIPYSVQALCFACFCFRFLNAVAPWQLCIFNCWCNASGMVWVYFNNNNGQQTRNTEYFNDLYKIHLLIAYRIVKMNSIHSNSVILCMSKCSNHFKGKTQLK